MVRTNRALATLIVATLIACALVMAINTRIASADNTEVITQTNLTGPALNGLTPHGVAEQRARNDGSRRLKVEVEDVNLPAGTALNVLVNGASIGTLTINSLHEGELELNTNDGQTVPNITNGTTVVVRTQAGATVVSGTFNITTPSPTPTPTATPTPSPTPERQRTQVSFDSATYTVAEDAGSLTVKVIRTGDLSHDGKVDYSTSDGTAQERTDFTTAAGRLFFAPGEASKTITILITDDAFVEPDESFTISLSDASDRTDIGNPGTAVITIKDNDSSSSPVTNTIDVNKSFITQHYMDFLNREPEPEGLKAWEDILNNCPQGDTRCDRIEVSSDFFRSPEFQDRGSFLYHFYSVSFGRIPHYAEFEKDMSRTSGFQTEAEKEANKALFAEDFMTRKEFTDRYGNLTDADFVNALLNTAGVILQNKDALIAALQNGTMTRAQVLRTIAESREVAEKFYNESFVVMQYFGYLRRDPDILYLKWIETLNRTGDYRTMINGFMNSGEYRQRFGR